MGESDYGTALYLKNCRKWWNKRNVIMYSIKERTRQRYCPHESCICDIERIVLQVMHYERNEIRSFCFVLKAQGLGKYPHNKQLLLKLLSLQITLPVPSDSRSESGSNVAIKIKKWNLNSRRGLYKIRGGKRNRPTVYNYIAKYDPLERYIFNMMPAEGSMLLAKLDLDTGHLRFVIFQIA